MESTFDLVIIGGGINGCALARLAAQNGFSVALFEENDFGSGVTSRSTRLIHGGLRYLESGRIGLVRESLHDRRLLLDEYPGQVKPLPFLIPVYQSDSRAAWYMSVGLKLYELFARDPELGLVQRLSPREVSSLEPGLETAGLRAGFQYCDCQATYPERLALEMALQAEEAGAVLANHTAVSGFLIEDGCVRGVKTRGPRGEEEFRARLVVNAAGAWIDRVLDALPSSGPKPLLTLLNGAHIVVAPFSGAPRRAVYHEARADRRPFFIIPWRGLYLIGTTETPFEGDPARVAPMAAEIEYLLAETISLFPGSGLGRESVLYAYAGSRPLLHASGGNWSSASREHRLYDHESRDGLKGLLTMAGGKLTTARSFALEVLTKAAEKLGRPVPSAPAIPADVQSTDERRMEIYGPRTDRLEHFARASTDGGEPALEGSPVTRGEILFAVEHEHARTLADIMLRRTGLGFSPEHQAGWAERVAAIAATSAAWEATSIGDAVAAYKSERERVLFPPGVIE